MKLPSLVKVVRNFLMHQKTLEQSVSNDNLLDWRPRYGECKAFGNVCTFDLDPAPVSQAKGKHQRGSDADRAFAPRIRQHRKSWFSSKRTRRDLIFLTQLCGGEFYSQNHSFLPPNGCDVFLSISAQGVARLKSLFNRLELTYDHPGDGDERSFAGLTLRFWKDSRWGFAGRELCLRQILSAPGLYSPPFLGSIGNFYSDVFSYENVSLNRDGVWIFLGRIDSKDARIHNNIVEGTRAHSRSRVVFQFSAPIQHRNLPILALQLCLRHIVGQSAARAGLDSSNQSFNTTCQALTRCSLVSRSWHRATRIYWERLQARGLLLSWSQGDFPILPGSKRLFRKILGFDSQFPLQFEANCDRLITHLPLSLWKFAPIRRELVQLSYLVCLTKVPQSSIRVEVIGKLHLASIDLRIYGPPLSSWRSRSPLPGNSISGRPFPLHGFRIRSDLGRTGTQTSKSLAFPKRDMDAQGLIKLPLKPSTQLEAAGNIVLAFLLLFPFSQLNDNVVVLTTSLGPTFAILLAWTTSESSLRRANLK